MGIEQHLDDACNEFHQADWLLHKLTDDLEQGKTHVHMSVNSVGRDIVVTIRFPDAVEDIDEVTDGRTKP